MKWKDIMTKTLTDVFTYLGDIFHQRGYSYLLHLVQHIDGVAAPAYQISPDLLAYDYLWNGQVTSLNILTQQKIN